uniref:Amythiamicin A/B n=1 Tax=Amycolatopsis sp. (strain MI481-42F4 / FERM P-12739) TaxID=613028 RepID=THCL1_AMISM|nr:RecName: Full=Amythiamicin A/B; Contains: RecName: Full=Amythiamicin C/D [Amycolatopsis sp. MI481-42F4]
SCNCVCGVCCSCSP